MSENQEYIEIVNMVENQSWGNVKHAISYMHAAEIVDMMRKLKSSARPIVFRLLSRDTAAYVFSELETDEQEALIDSMNEYEIKELLHEMSPDDRTSLFEELPSDITRKIFSLMRENDISITRKLLGYPEDSVGRIMTPEYLDVLPHFTVEKTIEHIRAFGKDSETFEVIYVVDFDSTLLGYILLKDLLTAKLEDKVESFMHTDVVYMSVYADQEEAVVISKKYDMLYIPVVDSRNALIGIVTVDDLFDVAVEEDTEDFHKLGAISIDEDFDVSIKQAGVFTLYKKRISWLFILVFVNIFSGAVIGAFQTIITEYVALIFFLPLLIDSAGNAGSQSSTLIIRSLATGDVKKSDWFFMLIKEIFISVSLGVTMSMAVALIAIFRGGFIIAIVVSTAMILVVLIGSLIGLCLPFILTKLKMDPAASSVPLVASLCDISGTAVYLSLASFILTKFVIMK